MEKIIENRDLQLVNLVDLAFFVSLIRHRIPAIKDFLLESFSIKLKSIFNLLLTTNKLPELPNEIKEKMKKDQTYLTKELKTEISNWWLLAHIFQMASEPKFLNILKKMNISLLVAPSSSFFITSDSPVAFYVPKYHKTSNPYGVGLLNKKIEITFPLSPNLVILYSWQKRNMLLTISDDLLSEINRRTIVMAQNFIYSHKQSKKTSTLIKKYHHITANHKILNLEYNEGFTTIEKFIPVTDN